ncbi:MAG: type II secretion system protein GspL, partial [Gammaproteobacteria bacterium]
LAALPEAQRCTRALIHATSDSEAQAIGDLLTGMSLEIAYRPLNNGTICLMATTVRDSRSINLLQGEFSLHDGALARWQRWRTAVALLVVLCIVFIVQQGVSEFSLRRESAALNAQITALFHQALPDVTRVVDPQVQMQQRLNQLTGGGASNTGLLPLLAAVGTTLQSQSGVQLQGFSYHGGTLQLQVQAANIDALNSMKSALTQNSSFQVSLDSVNSTSGQTTGRLTLSGSGG